MDEGVSEMQRVMDVCVGKALKSKLYALSESSL